MPQYRMTRPYARTFARHGVVEPGGVVEAPENPDPNFFEPAAPLPEAPVDKETAEQLDAKEDTVTTPVPADPEPDEEPTE